MPSTWLPRIARSPAGYHRKRTSLICTSREEPGLSKATPSSTMAPVTAAKFRTRGIVLWTQGSH